ncbi:carbonic anhydrase [Phytohabitans rumicis]|uniref:carbonic anhydrase n=1 Tax=Phytohabitans rumicis TaxID=1076125 RepID=A0A6V8L0S0_9ACTN|nr:carbonic anhydrase [Phytohabitans rumicis]GFJ88381.1 carbonic anhydrase [Phytohabitans rumicis]
MPRNLPRRSLLAAAATGLAAGATALAGPALAARPATPATEPAADTPAKALNRLLAGNHRFASGHPIRPHQTPQRLREVAAGQHPFAITLGCADSRVPPEVLFDQGLGDIFDNRVAGNIVDDLLLGSVEFAVEEFAPPVLMVLGHERCGAITATINALESGGEAPGHIGSIVDALRPIVEPLLESGGDRVDIAVRANVRAQARQLVATSELIAERVAAGTLAVVGARYDLDTGRVTLVH